MNSACFRIHSDSLSPYTISARLETQPSASFEKGTLLSTRNPRSSRRDAALWIFQSSDPGASLAEQIREILRFVEDKSDALKKLSEHCHFDVFCGFTPREGERMLILEPDLFRQFQIVPIQLFVDFLPANE